MDYLLRDSYFTGVEYGKVDIHRVIHSLQVLEGHLVVEQAALYAFEAIRSDGFPPPRFIFYRSRIWKGGHTSGNTLAAGPGRTPGRGASSALRLRSHQIGWIPPSAIHILPESNMERWTYIG